MTGIILSFAGMVAAFFLGLCVCFLQREKEALGTVHIDRSDPDGPHLFLELKGPVDEIADKRVMWVLIDDHNLTARK